MISFIFSHTTFIAYELIKIKDGLIRNFIIGFRHTNYDFIYSI